MIAFVVSRLIALVVAASFCLLDLFPPQVILPSFAPNAILLGTSTPSGSTPQHNYIPMSSLTYPSGSKQDS